MITYIREQKVAGTIGLHRPKLLVICPESFPPCDAIIESPVKDGASPYEGMQCALNCEWGCLFTRRCVFLRTAMVFHLPCIRRQYMPWVQSHQSQDESITDSFVAFSIRADSVVMKIRILYCATDAVQQVFDFTDGMDIRRP